MENLIKIKPDKERARSLIKLASLRYGKIKTFDEEKESSLIIEGYYEAAKELITAVLFIDGYKTLSHKDLIEYLKERYAAFGTHEIVLLDELRVLRNRVTYEGFSIVPSYLNRNEQVFKAVARKLKELLERKL